MARPNRPPGVSLYVSDQALTGESARTRIRKAPFSSSVVGVATAAVPRAGIEKAAESRTAPPTQYSTVPDAGKAPVTKTVVSKRAESPAPFAPGPPHKVGPLRGARGERGGREREKKGEHRSGGDEGRRAADDSPDMRTVSRIPELRSFGTCLRRRRCTSYDTADAPP